MGQGLKPAFSTSSHSVVRRSILPNSSYSGSLAKYYSKIYLESPFLKNAKKSLGPDIVIKQTCMSGIFIAAKMDFMSFLLISIYLIPRAAPISAS